MGGFVLSFLLRLGVIITGMGKVVFSGLPLFWQGKKEGRTCAWLRLYPNFSFVEVDNFFDGGKSDAGAVWLGGGVDSLEGFKDAIKVFWFDTNAVVGDAKLPEFFGFCASNKDFSLRFVVVFDGVAD